MSNKTLAYINNQLKQLNIDYAFMRFETQPNYPYCVGSYREVSNNNEINLVESVFTLNLFTRNGMGWVELLALNEKIKKMFNNITVKMSPTETVAFFYDNHYLIEDDDIDLKRMELLIRVHEWSD